MSNPENTINKVKTVNGMIFPVCPSCEKAIFESEPKSIYRINLHPYWLHDQCSDEERLDSIRLDDVE